MKRFFFMTFLTVLLVSTGFVGVSRRAQAQGIQIVNANDVILQTNPELPGPFEEVVLSLKSFVVNLDTSRITWIVNGEELLSGIGEKEITTTSGNLGESLLVEVRIRWNQIDTLTKRIRIEPAYVDLLWEAPDSYVPPFYRGKALPASEGYLKVVALPSGVITNDQYVYTWEHNGDVKQDQSGFKKNSFTIRNNFFDNRFSVAVNVTGRLKPFRAQASLILPRFDPEIRFAVQDLDGNPIYQNNGGFTIDGGLNRLIAYPYHFSAADGFDDLDFQWTIDGERYFPPASLSGLENEIPLVPPEGTAGYSNVALKIDNTNEILQQASAETQVRF
ncbi:hypothetical protein H6776_00180 [Candidatus Nomurabacteria bacterium]|nr:hypothetical protein [Candidatus Nomurabacteria bacterium]